MANQRFGPDEVTYFLFSCPRLSGRGCDVSACLRDSFRGWDRWPLREVFLEQGGKKLPKRLLGLGVQELRELLYEPFLLCAFALRVCGLKVSQTACLIAATAGDVRCVAANSYFSSWASGV